MMELDRRYDHRIPLEMYLNTYIAERPTRGFTTNISESGIYLNTLTHQPIPAGTPMGIEFALPGIKETIWAAGEICYETPDDYFLGQGIRFTAMAKPHDRLLRAYCWRLRRDKLFGLRR